MILKLHVYRIKIGKLKYDKIHVKIRFEIFIDAKVGSGKNFFAFGILEQDALVGFAHSQ